MSTKGTNGLVSRKIGHKSRVIVPSSSALLNVGIAVQYYRDVVGRGSLVAAVMGSIPVTITIVE